jgi:hypothetical protein
LLHLGCAKVASLISQFAKGCSNVRGAPSPALCSVRLSTVRAHVPPAAIPSPPRLHCCLVRVSFFVSEGQPLERIKDILAKGTKTDSTATK